VRGQECCGEGLAEEWRVSEVAKSGTEGEEYCVGNGRRVKVACTAAREYATPYCFC
jgi:hypothetical protein